MPPHDQQKGETMSNGKCPSCGTTMVNTGGEYSTCPVAPGCCKLRPQITPAQAVEWEFTSEEIPGLIFNARDTKSYGKRLQISKLPVAATMPGPQGGAIYKYQGETLYRIDGLDGLYGRRMAGPVEAARSAGEDQWGMARMVINRFVKVNVVQRKKKGESP